MHNQFNIYIVERSLEGLLKFASRRGMSYSITRNLRTETIFLWYKGSLKPVGIDRLGVFGRMIAGKFKSFGSIEQILEFAHAYKGARLPVRSHSIQPLYGSWTEMLCVEVAEHIRAIEEETERESHCIGDFKFDFWRTI